MTKSKISEGTVNERIKRGEIVTIIGAIWAFSISMLNISFQIYRFDEAFLALGFLVVGLSVFLIWLPDWEWSGFEHYAIFLISVFSFSAIVHFLAIIPIGLLMPHISTAFFVLAGGSLIYGVYHLMIQKIGSAVLYAGIAAVYFGLHFPVNAYLYPVINEGFFSMGFYGFYLVWLLFAILSPITVVRSLISISELSSTKEGSEDPEHEGVIVDPPAPQTALAQSITKINNVIPFPTRKK